MVQVPRDDNVVTGLLVKGSLTGVDLVVEGDETTKGIHTHIVGDDSAATGINGGHVSVGTSQVEMTFTGTTKGIMVQSKVTNTGSIWVGPTGVTNAGNNAFAQLSPGQSVSIDFNDSSIALYAISDVASQTIYKSALV